MNVRDKVRQIRTRIVQDGAAVSGSSLAAVRQHEELIELRGCYARLHQIRNSLGQMPPSPNTQRGRLGVLLVRVVQRMLFWYTPQILRFQNEVAAAFDHVCRVAEWQRAELIALRRDIQAMHPEFPIGVDSPGEAARPARSHPPEQPPADSGGSFTG